MMVALDPSGASKTVEFLEDDTPGVLNTDTRSITHVAGIVQLTLIPGAGDYVAYGGLKFNTGPMEVICTPATPVRGVTIDCSVAARGTSTVVVTGWSFVPSDAEMPSVSLAAPVTQWSGPLVTPGTLKATGLTASQRPWRLSSP